MLAMAQTHTHYDNLNVTRNAPPEVIRAAYKALSQRYHPDKNASPDATRIMEILNHAYAVLSDAEARRGYDVTIANHPHAPAWADVQVSNDAAPASAFGASLTGFSRGKLRGWATMIALCAAVSVQFIAFEATHRPASASRTATAPRAVPLAAHAPLPASDASTASAGYAERVGRRVRTNIAWTNGVAGLETAIGVRCAPNGALLSATVVRSSGNGDWDRTALRAVQRLDPMPDDTNGETPASFAVTVRSSGN